MLHMKAFRDTVIFLFLKESEAGFNDMKKFMIKNNHNSQSVEVLLECPLVSHANLARHGDVESEFE